MSVPDKAIPDFKSGEQLLAEDLQALKETAMNPPIRFGKGFRVASLLGGGMAVTLDVPPGRADRFAWVKITGDLAGGGKYEGEIVKEATADLATSGNLAESDIGDLTDAETCYIINVREVGKATHDLDDTGFLPLIFLGRRRRANADGTPVFIIDGSQHEDCD